MWRPASEIRASVTIAAIAIALLWSHSRDEPPHRRSRLGWRDRIDAGASHRAVDEMGGSGDGHDGQMCWA